jgi:hypothetical protein
MIPEMSGAIASTTEHFAKDNAEFEPAIDPRKAALSSKS